MNIEKLTQIITALTKAFLKFKNVILFRNNNSQCRHYKNHVEEFSLIYVNYWKNICLYVWSKLLTKLWKSVWFASDSSFLVVSVFTNFLWKLEVGVRDHLNIEYDAPQLTFKTFFYNVYRFHSNQKRKHLEALFSVKFLVNFVYTADASLKIATYMPFKVPTWLSI